MAEWVQCPLHNWRSAQFTLHITLLLLGHRTKWWIDDRWTDGQTLVSFKSPHQMELPKTKQNMNKHPQSLLKFLTVWWNCFILVPKQTTLDISFSHWDGFKMIKQSANKQWLFQDIMSAYHIHRYNSKRKKNIRLIIINTLWNRSRSTRVIFMEATAVGSAPTFSAEAICPKWLWDCPLYV